jgi:hypothetical protein
VASKPAKKAASNEGSGSNPPGTNNPPAPPQTGPVQSSTSRQYDELLEKNVGDIQDYMDDNPDEANKVKDAEEDRAERDGDEPRKGVVDYDVDDERDEEPLGADAVEDDDGAEVDEGYNPYHDPDVPSSAVAEVIAVELKSGKSKTLAAVRAAKEAR